MLINESELQEYAEFDPDRDRTDFSSYRTAALYAREIIRLRKAAERFEKLSRLAKGTATFRAGVFGGYRYDNPRYEITVTVPDHCVNREEERLTMSFVDALDALVEQTKEGDRGGEEAD